jgi:hypothetical protein
MFFLTTIKSNAELKKELHWLLIPRSQIRPKLLVKFFLNWYFLKKGENIVMPFKKVVDYFLFINFQTYSGQKV